MNKDKIKICYVVAADITLKFILFSQIRFLMEHHYDVHVVCPKGKWLSEFKEMGVTVKEIEIKRTITPLFDLVSIANLFFYFKKEQFDVVHTFTPKPGLLGQMAAKMAGVPIIFNTIFGFYVNESTSPLKRALFIFIEKLAGRISTAIFFRNREDFETAELEHIGQKEKNIYVGDGIDMARFNPKRFNELFIKEKKQTLGIKPNIFIIGIVARLVAEKGYLELFSAFAKVLEKFPDAVLLVIGPVEPQKKDAIGPAIVKRFGIEKNVKFLGERTDVDELFPLMDIFVLPSHREGFSHSIMEASAMARPIIASDIRGCRGAVIHSKTGWLIPPKNPEKLAEAMVYFLENPDIAKQMGSLAQKKAEQEFDEQLLFEKTEHEYRTHIKKIF